MELSEAIEKFKADLADVKSNGKQQIEIVNLEGYLDSLLASASLSADARRAVHESNLAHYNAQVAMSVENFKAVLQAGKEAINAAIIINGGAVIALMSFMGNAVGKDGARYIVLLSSPLWLFGWGVFLGGMAFGARYISQFLYAGLASLKWGRIMGHLFNGVSWLATLSSLLCFALGVLVSYHNLVGS